MRNLEGYVSTTDYARQNGMSYGEVYRIAHEGRLEYKRVGKRLYIKSDAPVVASTEQPKGFVTIKELTEKCNISARWILDCIHRGELEATRFGRKFLLSAEVELTKVQLEKSPNQPRGGHKERVKILKGAAAK